MSSSYGTNGGGVMDTIKNLSLYQTFVVIALVVIFVLLVLMMVGVGNETMSDLQMANSGPNLRHAGMRTDGVGASQGNRHYDPLSGQYFDNFLGGPEPPVFNAPQVLREEVNTAVHDGVSSAPVKNNTEGLTSINEQSLENLIRG